jgi:transposase
MKTRMTKKQKEARRMLAAEFFEQGIGPAEVARRLGVTVGAASQWRKAFRERGKEALRSKPHPGSQPKLPRSKWPSLAKVLLEGPRAHGFATELWTLARVAEVIRRRFGVRYDTSQVSRILHAMGWSRQRPTRRARERDEQAIESWRAREWPRIKKGL